MGLSAFDLLKLTCCSLRGNPLRSFLTALSIFMGVAAVSATLQVGSISRSIIARQLAERDLPQVMLELRRERGSTQSTEMNLTEIEFLRRNLSGWQSICAIYWVGSSPVEFQFEQANPLVLAVSEEFLLASGRKLVAGRFFTTADFTSYRSIAAIDRFLANKLFKGQQAIGQHLYVEGRPYVIVGVVQTKLEGDVPPEGQVIVPISVYNALTASHSIHIIRIRPNEIKVLESLGNQAEQLLAQRYPGRSFWVWNNVEDILQQQKILELSSQALAVVAAISLLVAGVGIANITIASVKERTTEIGLRRAIGATQANILMQLVLESTLLSLLGGTAATGVVHGLTVTIADAFNFPYQFQVEVVALALSSALLVGIGASLSPALQASQMEPDKALRSE
ncbi:MAG: hypothetical protein CLLPBCKN_000954 [Chroococcidiopsis cubana SAG 39.79]|nr:ABC transporter permease [Chroococcidiopsis cubana]MDZ4871566.1 hypothetical protein [Chroococcidiopsis cubana SAG 39.79]PSB62397.1 macrolide ABC transporter ATP-binding protein [Chroococcidiopsis cubana CCALA 043]